MSAIVRVLAIVLLLLAAGPRARAVDFTVDSQVDAVDAAPGNGLCATAGGACTLRAAVQEADALAGADRILLPAGTFTLTIAGPDEDAAATGDLDVTEALTIEGAGPDATVVDAAGLDRVFDVGVETTIRGLTITGGDAALNGGGIWSAPYGGDFTLTIERVHFTGNVAGHGGAIQNAFQSTLVVRQSSFSGNTATFGAAIENEGTTSIENTTVSGNGTGSGGGLRDDVDLSLSHVTVVGDSIVSSGSLTLRATVLDAGAAGTVCVAPTSATSDGDNVEHGTSCGLAGTGDQSGVDPLLGPLADAGDGTLSHALLAGSPAIDVVAACPPPSVDQRGVTRPIGPACDAGAIEAPLPGGTTTSTSTPPPTTTTTTMPPPTTSTSTPPPTTTTTTIPPPTTSTSIPPSTTTTTAAVTTTSTSTTVLSTTSTSTSLTSTTSVPGSSTTSTSVSITTSTVVSTVTTTTVAATTTTTTLPPALLLSGRKLLLTDSARPARRKAVLLSKDPALTLGDGNGSADDPVGVGGSVRVVAVGGDGFDATYPLAASGWKYLKGEGQNRGYKFRKGTPVRKVLLKPGKVLKLVAKGDALAQTLATQPDAVRVEVRLGGRRYCFEFGGTPSFKAGKRYLAKDAGAPAGCASDAAD